MTSTLTSSFNQSSKTIVTCSSNGKIIFTTLSVGLIFDAGRLANTTYNSFLTPLYNLIQELEENQLICILTPYEFNKIKVFCHVLE